MATLRLRHNASQGCELSDFALILYSCVTIDWNPVLIAHAMLHCCCPQAKNTISLMLDNYT